MVLGVVMALVLRTLPGEDPSQSTREPSSATRGDAAAERGVVSDATPGGG